MGLIIITSLFETNVLLRERQADKIIALCGEVGLNGRFYPFGLNSIYLEIAIMLYYDKIYNGLSNKL